MPKQKEPSMPFLIEVDDYHEFRFIQACLNLINTRIKVAELDDYSSMLGAYLGVVYEGRRPSKAAIKKMVDADEIQSPF
jgi:hypothetical protein